MSQYDPIVVKSGIPSVLSTDTLRADRESLAGMTTAGLTTGDICYVSGTNTLSPAVNTNSNPIVGVYDNISGSVVTRGVVPVGFISGLTINPGDVCYVSETAGKLTNVKSTSVGLYQLEVGTILDTTEYTNPNYTCVILLQPKWSILVAA